MPSLDPNNGQAVKTAYDNLAKFQVVDGQSGQVATKKLTVANDGDTITAGVNDFGLVQLVKGTDGKHHEALSDSSGHQLVSIVPVNGTSTVCDYSAFTGATTLVPGTIVSPTATPQTHSKAITASKTAMNINVTVASAGLVKWDIGTNNGTTFTILKTVITSPAHPADRFTLTPPNSTAPGTGTFSIQVNGTNLDIGGATADGYSTLEWTEM